MKKLCIFIAVLCWFVAGQALFAQGVWVNRDNKTVSVSVTESIEVQPEIGVVTLGYQNFGRTQDTVFEENIHAAEKIVKALLAAGVKKEDIETQTLQLGRTEEPIKQTNTKQDQGPQFQAQQLWRIRVLVGDVQKVVDQAVAAGANDIQDVDWGVKDPDALDTKARAHAISKAKDLAQEIAQSLGGKAGALLFVSNNQVSAYAARFGNSNAFGNMGLSTVEVVSSARLPMLNLFPQKVKREATIYAVFVLE